MQKKNSKNETNVCFFFEFSIEARWLLEMNKNHETENISGCKRLDKSMYLLSESIRIFCFLGFFLTIKENFDIYTDIQSVF
jgi:hypothetical protein